MTKLRSDQWKERVAYVSDLGGRAYLAGIPIDKCPFPPGEDADYWREGWELEADYWSKQA